MSTRPVLVAVMFGWAVLAGLVWLLWPPLFNSSWFIYVYFGVLIGLCVVGAVVEYREKKILKEDFSDLDGKH